MSTERFLVLAADETKYWNSKALKRCGIRQVFCLHLIREGEATFCCSMTPSSWAVPVRNVFIFTADASPDMRERVLIELEYEGLGAGAYFPFASFSKCRPGTARAFEIDLDETEFEDTEEGQEAYRDAAWDQALEYVQTNDVEPPCCWGRLQ